MKSIFLALVLVFSTESLFAKTLIVSDVDDTIKMTNVLGNKATLIYNGLIRKEAFSGMSELYNELAKEEGAVFHYVSGSPKVIRFRVKNFLEKNEFPQSDNLTLKAKFKTSIIDYKVETIRALIVKENPDKIILIGDDTEYDPEIYETIQKENTETVQSIYIRSVQGRELPNLSMVKGFISAPEIAAHEMTKGNLDAKALSNVANGFIYKTYKSGLFLSESFCPVEGSEEIDKLETEISDSEAQFILGQVQKKIKNSCIIRAAN
ncbi:MAG: DUF2183 domain-containing protein [Bdellovibrionales bacterium]|nr:DUF2183 domain-containing protein [Bdellovibrionales bacterium]